MSQKNELPLARKKRTKKLPYLLIAPAILLFCAFTFYPFIRAIVLSFAVTDKRGNFAKWVGIGNWLRVLKKDEFWNVVVVTLKMAAANLVFTFSIAMIFALLATKKVRWSKLYQTMYALPMAIASSPGAGPFERIRKIILPLASPQIFFVLFLNINNSFKCFNQIKLLTQGGPANSTKTLIYYIYENAIVNGRFETACVQAIFLFLMIFILTRIQFALEDKVVHYQ